MRSKLSRYLAAGAISAFAAPVAYAGGIAPVVYEAAPVAIAPVAPLTDWTGIYGGLSYGKAMGSLDDGLGSVDFEDGTAPGIFVGYNWQNGNFVFGGELAYNGVSDMTLTGFPAVEFKNSIDLKARVGFAAGRAMPYLVVGYSMASFDEPLDSHDVDGVSYGVGLDYLVTDSVFVGVEYLKRDLSGDGFDVDASTLGLRIGYKF